MQWLKDYRSKNYSKTFFKKFVKKIVKIFTIGIVWAWMTEKVRQTNRKRMTSLKITFHLVNMIEQNLDLYIHNLFNVSDSYGFFATVFHSLKQRMLHPKGTLLSYSNLLVWYFRMFYQDIRVCMSNIYPLSSLAYTLYYMLCMTVVLKDFLVIVLLDA